ncbi:bifunctional nicotinamidase/pyrazinamidase [Legionella sp. W05-934-2]|jgi:nicotinamidase/pyrazinamidase|uniref:bifunctional nicotinamidase/pyrazinamidase n=1 Tax=Legionella sp. W05-934-2 TaxID=1198649 RepID=UPI003462DC09
MKVLILVDVQNDFMPTGALPVPDGDAIVPIINQEMTQFDLVVATQDWHPHDHLSFASNHPGKKPFDVIRLDGYEQILWPDHCIQGSHGAALHPQLNQNPIEAIIRKGSDKRVDSYSGFYDNHRKYNTGLAGYLRARGVTSLYFAGLAADICVYCTIQDAVSEGFECTLIDAATRPLDKAKYEQIKQKLRQQQVRII